MNEQNIADIVKRVVSELHTQTGGTVQRTGGAVQRTEPAIACAGGAVSGGRDGVFEDINDAIRAAAAAQRQLETFPLADRKKFIKAIRETSKQHAKEWAELAVADTGMGRADHKAVKNYLAYELTPGVEELETTCVTGDKGLMIQEYAPFGVIATITPSTNPTATVINHSIAMISAGNSVVFGPHPGAVKSTLECMQGVNRALVAAGAPANLLTTVSNPTLRTAKELMTHPDIKLLVATGGPAVVRAAMESPKRAIVAGPGNPPVIVDDTVDMPTAATRIYEGATFDNNMPCICEKEAFILSSVYDLFLAEMQNRGAYLLDQSQTEAIMNVVTTDDGHVNRDWVGQDAAKIAKSINLQIPSNCELLIAEVDNKHPFVVNEMLMPILGCVKVDTFEQAVDYAVEAEHGFGHTAIIHSQRMDRITYFAKKIRVNLFVSNGSCGAVLGYGGEGWTAFTIAGSTGEGPCTPKTFSKIKRFSAANNLRVV